MTLVDSYNIVQYLTLCYLLSFSIFSDDLESEPKKMEASAAASSQKMIKKKRRLPSKKVEQHVDTSDGKLYYCI